MALPSKIAIETLAVKEAIGAKSGQVTFTVSMTIAAMAIAFSRGWQLFLSILLIAPFWLIACLLLVKISISGYTESTAAYTKSASYAEQALSAIKVVVSFGVENKEVKNYTKHLDVVFAVGCKTHLFSGFTLGLLFMVLYAAYAFSFWIGTYYI